MTSFKSGDRVVYPHHGAAVIQRTETREHNGTKTKYFVLQAVHDNLTVRVPVDMADEVGMRLPISEEDVQDLFVSGPLVVVASKVPGEAEGAVDLFLLE